MNSNQQENQNGPAYTVLYGKFYKIKNKIDEKQKIIVQRRVLVEVSSVVDHSIDFYAGRY